MQVNISEDRVVVGNCARLNSQVESRKFNVLADRLNRIPETLDGLPDTKVKAYKDKIVALSKTPRRYQKVGNASCDNLWELELLGLGMYTKEYVAVIDFSQALDFILEVTFGCNRQRVREIQNYEEISYRLMNYDVDGAANTFNEIFNEDDIAVHVYATVMKKVYEKSGGAELSMDERLSCFVYNFYTEILESVGAIKNYIGVYLQMRNTGNIAYRSKTFSSVILTANEPIEDIVVHMKDGIEYEVPVKNYKPLEYLLEAVTNEIGREFNNRK